MPKIEFYRLGESKHIAVLDDGAVPRVGELISIRKQTWRVEHVTWAVDNADDVMCARLRACVDLVLPSPAPTDAETP